MARIGVPTESLAGAKPVPAGFYKVKLTSFKPQLSSKKDSINLNARLEVVSLAPNGMDLKAFSGQPQIPDGQPATVRETNSKGQEEEHDLKGSGVFVGLNTKGGWIMEAFTHAFGFPMQEDVNPVTGDSESLMPGQFPQSSEGDPPEQWGKYEGPLLNSEAVVELVQTETKRYNAASKQFEPTGQFRNETKQFICRLSGCEVKHSTNLIRPG